MRSLKTFLVVLALVFPCGVWGANPTVVQGVSHGGIRQAIKVDNSGRLTGGIHVIDACEATTGWTALGNDTTGLDTDLDHVLGAKSLEFDKVDGAANTVFGGIQKTISSVDLSSLVENGGAFGYSLNVGATTDIAYCFLRLGTDASNYNEWRVADAGLSAGWNSLRFNADVPSGAGATGNGWNAAVVTYLALGCAFDLETSTLADLRVDHVTANVGLQVAADVNASVSSASGASQVDVQKLGGNAIDLGAGAVGTGTLRTTLGSDDPAVASLSTIAGDTTSLDGKVTVDDGDSGGGTDNVQRVLSVVPGAGGAVLPDVGAGNAGTGTPRMSISIDDVNLAAINADTTTIAADTTSIDADTTTIAADTTSIDADTTTIAADTTSIDADTTTIAADTTSIDADTTTIAGDTTSLDAKVTTMDLDTGGGTDNRQVVGLAVAASGGAVANSASAPVYTFSTGSVTTTISEGPAATDATPDLVLTSQDVSKEACWGIQISNSGGNPLTDADVQISRDLGTTWSSLTWTSCDSLAAGSVCDYDFPANSYTNVRIYTTSTAGTTVTLLLSSRR